MKEQAPDELWLENADEIVDGEAEYLGRQETIDALVRSFLSDALDVKGRNDERDPKAQDPEKWLRDRLAVEARRLIGQDNSFLPVPFWNTPDPDTGILRQIQMRYNFRGGTPEQIASVPFYMVLQGGMDAIKAAEEGKDFQLLVEGPIETAVATILGVDQIIYED
jgi:hypothetical protein